MPLEKLKLLILVPTWLELRVLRPAVSALLPDDSVRFELCGFGPIAAAAQSAHLLARHQPDQVLLAGIAGSLCEELAPGSACHFQSVACCGIGAGTGEQHVSAGQMGWKHWAPADDHSGIGEIGDRLDLQPPPFVDPPPSLLLTCCAASASDADVRLRQQRFPDAVAEDMEGFGVAVACRLAGIPLDIVRGISNRAGDRCRTGWKIQEALEAAAELLLRYWKHHVVIVPQSADRLWQGDP